MSEPPTSGAEPAGESAGRRLARHPSTWLAAVLLIVLLPLLWASSAPRPDERPPPVLGRVGDFHLIDRQGRAVDAASLEGRAWVGSVHFTRCPTVCPQQLEVLRGVERDTRVSAAEARFVSFTADPEHDTPEVLSAYAAAKGTDSERWIFLTGEPAAARAAVVEGLRLGLGEDGRAPEGIFHAIQVVLVDRDRNVRGYYRSDDPEAMDRLVHDLLLVSGFKR